MSTTRMSSTMASIILRRFSAWLLFACGEVDLLILVTALDDVRHLLANSLRNIVDRDEVSSPNRAAVRRRWRTRVPSSFR